MKSDTLMDRLLTPGALSVVLQPILDVSSQGYELHALECLTRGPRGTNLEGADMLFDYVRRKREEGTVDRLCIRSAIHTSSLLPGSHKISINVHASTLASDQQFIPFLEQTASAYALDTSRLIVEIVEHSRWWDGQALLATLDRLRDIGAAIALDDVGLGQSNLKMILDCRPEYLKVDRYFVSGVAKDPYRLVLLESLAKIAQKFGSHVIAEGVETAEDLERLRSLGIHLMQGYLFWGTGSPTEILRSGLLTHGLDSQWPSVAVEETYGSH
jgi:EAL domain-containing protein (putative c-di-GMP-specific phosphodiesterase class I)